MAHIKTSTREERSARGKLAVATRDHGPDHPATCTARREFRSEAYLAAVKAAVADAPPLTAEQRQRLSQILRPVVGTLTSGGVR